MSEASGPLYGGSNNVDTTSKSSRYKKKKKKKTRRRKQSIAPAVGPRVKARHKADDSPPAKQREKEKISFKHILSKFNQSFHRSVSSIKSSKFSNFKTKFHPQGKVTDDLQVKKETKSIPLSSFIPASTMTPPNKSLAPLGLRAADTKSKSPNIYTLDTAAAYTHIPMTNRYIRTPTISTGSPSSLWTASSKQSSKCSIDSVSSEADVAGKSDRQFPTPNQTINQTEPSHTSNSILPSSNNASPPTTGTKSNVTSNFKDTATDKSTGLPRKSNVTGTECHQPPRNLQHPQLRRSTHPSGSRNELPLGIILFEKPIKPLAKVRYNDTIRFLSQQPNSVLLLSPTSTVLAMQSNNCGSSMGQSPR